MSSFSIPDTLKRGVGRKILGLFLVAAVIPVVFTAGFAWSEFGRTAMSEARDDLHASAKSYGVDILVRLEDAARKAEEIALLHVTGEPLAQSHAYLVEEFAAIWIADAVGEARVVTGNTSDVVALGDVDNEFIARGETQLLVNQSGYEPSLTLVRALPGAVGTDRVIAFRLQPENIWGPRENIPFNTDFCVYESGGARLYCTNVPGSPGLSLLTPVSPGVQNELMAWTASEIDYIGVSFQLFLAGNYKTSSFEIVAAQPRTFALQSSTDFRRVFLPSMALVLVLVGLLSLSAVGQSLGPLHWLTAAAKQLASGNLSARVRIRTNDEFESLGDAFNNMASRLGEQIDMLQAMSGIDRMILTGASFEDVAKCVIGHLTNLMNCDVAAVIAHDEHSGQHARMVTGDGEKFSHEIISLPNELGFHWCQPQQVTLEDVDPNVAPYRDKFLSLGQSYVIIIPVVLQEDMKGVLLIGTREPQNLKKASLLRCVDLAGRFAVALSSVEREDALYRQAHYDELTGLPNRQLLKERLADMIAHARVERHVGALLYLDLDRFKEINDVYGHSVGDVVLTQTSERIISEVRDEDIVARLGGDEFVVVVPHVIDNDRIKSLASRLLERLTEEFSVLGASHFVGASIGIVMFPDDGDSVETLLKNADAAMYRAKEAGRARYAFFNVELNDESRRKIELERDLRVGFASGELSVYYQPQFDLGTGVISGAEALLRWSHPEHGSISPSEFVPLAEDSDLINEIGDWVIEQTCRDLRRILELQLHPGPVSINVSARQLRDPGFVDDVLGSLQRNQIHPGYLQLEVTETTVAQNRDTAIDILNGLREHGVRVAIDDFGTGYSSLSYLQNMPFDVIKIDKSFVDTIGGNAQADNICRTIIRMAHELGKTSIAEGVETTAQVDFLRQNQCDVVQGFHFSEALPLNDFIAFIRKQDFHTQRRKALEIV